MYHKHMEARDLRDHIAHHLGERNDVTEVKAMGSQINVYFSDVEYEIVIRTTHRAANQVSKKNTGD